MRSTKSEAFKWGLAPLIDQASLFTVGLLGFYPSPTASSHSFRQHRAVSHQWTWRQWTWGHRCGYVVGVSVHTLKCINRHKYATEKRREQQTLEYVYFKHFCCWPQSSPAPFTLFFLFKGFWWGWEGGLLREMRCLNTPLPSTLHPTPPHTWDGHFISECCKWKGDLNLPCFPLTPLPLSISHTQSLILLMDSTLLVA